MGRREPRTLLRTIRVVPRLLPNLRWLLANPRVQLHFTPTYSSWISQAGRWFAELQRRCLDRGVFCSLDQLTTALEDWISIWNAHARPFKWTKTADQIIDPSAATAHASPDRDTRRRCADA